MTAKPQSISDCCCVAAVRESLLAHVVTAQKLLRQGRPPTDTDVHEARKSIKRARAMLQLLRPALNARDFALCKVGLRDAGRALSIPRDARVIAEIFAEVSARVDIPKDALAAIATELRVETGSPLDGATGRRRAASAARTSLSATRLRLIRASLHENDQAVLCGGVRSVYRRGRRRMPENLKSATAEAMHEWRKQVKRYWHVMEIFVSVRPAQIRRSVRDARRLADLLGEDHDLELLAGKLRAIGDNAESPVRALLVAIKARHKQLRRRALKIGAELYAEPPAEMEKRLHDRKRLGERAED
jgi:CHAD domain-containing protein